MRINGASQFVLLTKYYLGNHIKETEIDGECNTRKRVEVNTEFYSENLKGKHYLEDLGKDMRIILK